MTNAGTVIDSVIAEIDNLKKNIKKKTSKQIQNVDEKGLLKATGFAWFQSHKSKLLTVEVIYFKRVDELFHHILDAGDKNSSRVGVLEKLNSLKGELVSLRKQLILLPQTAVKTNDVPPDFSSLISNEGMRHVLSRRWNECRVCVENNTPLAATVMIGGLLEGLLLSKIHQEPDQSKIYKAKSAPIDKTTSKPKPLSEWTLNNFIDLCHELGWISKPTKDVSSTLREYRNYIHPHKEFANGLTLEPSDAILFWEIAKTITRQLL